MHLKKFALSNKWRKRVWVTKTGCMGQCNNEGATVVIHPENLWFSKVTIKDLPKLEKEIANLISE